MNVWEKINIETTAKINKALNNGLHVYISGGVPHVFLDGGVGICDLDEIDDFIKKLEQVKVIADMVTIIESMEVEL